MNHHNKKPEHCQPTVPTAPPRADLMEQGVLGSMLLSGKAVSIAREKLPPAAFYNLSHRDIYEAILAVCGNGAEPDIILVEDALQKADKLEKCGGRSKLVDLIDAVPSWLQIEYYIACVIEYYRRRKGLRLANALRQRVLDPSADVDEALGTSKAELEALAEQPVASGSYFDGKTFVPIRLARAIEETGIFVFGHDPEGDSGQLMQYKDGVWRPATSLDVQAQELLGDKVRRFRVDEAMKAVERDVPRLPWSAWNRHRQLINCRSGMLDPVTLELCEHSPDYYSTMQIPVEWNPDARHARLERFLGEVLQPEDGELTLMMLGYLLIPNLSAGKFFVLQGPADTGKTTFLTIGVALVGERNVTQVSLQDLADNRFAAASLENKLLCVFDDMGSKPLRDTSIPKVLTGGINTLRIERKGRDAYLAPLYARLLFTTNDMPSAPDKSRAWYKRLCLLPFTKVIPRDKSIPNLAAQLITPEALQYLFAAAVGGLQELIANRMRFPETRSSAEALAAYQMKNDTVAAFVQDGCELGPQVQVRRAAWYESYQQWCAANGHKPVGRNTAYVRLRGSFAVSDGKDVAGHGVFRGIGCHRDKA